LPVKDATSEKISVTIPPDASGKELHLILEVWDRSDIVPLAAYRRAVVNVAK
jgi:predicted carbohydrate-binding protein with CBM5 and CBM33 domain